MRLRGLLCGRRRARRGVFGIRVEPADAVDRFYLERACELADLGVGNTSPNPPVGAVIVRDGRTLGEGHHQRRGGPHAEIEALRAARNDVAGATLYVTLEPCDQHGLTPPCTDAVIESGIARVVVGARDPNAGTPGGGAARLRESGIRVDVVDHARAAELIDAFSVNVTERRAFVTLKMASSLDGFIAPKPGIPHWLTGAQAGAFVRELRSRHDAVMVGGGTVVVDDPRLTVRPPHARALAYRRICVCDARPVSPQSRIFTQEQGYGATIVLAAGLRERFSQVERLAEVLFIGGEGARQVDMRAGLAALREHGISSVLCEGGPKLAARLLEAGLVDRLEWLVAPKLLAAEDAVRALPPLAAPNRSWAVAVVEQLGSDVRISARAAQAA